MSAYPKSDDEFDAWQENFYTQVNAHLAILNLPPGELDPITAGRADWNVKFPDHKAEQIIARAKTTAKDGSLTTYQGALTPFVARLQLNPAMTNELRVLFGLTVRKTTRSAARTMESIPELEIEFGRLFHIVHFHDVGRPRGSAKPEGAKGCEIWRSIVPTHDPAPTDPEQFVFLTTDSDTPYRSKFVAEDAGKTAYYAARWVNTADVPGDWSEIFSATIAGV